MGSEGPLHYESVNNAYHLIGAINKLRQHSQLCDLFLHCGDVKIPAHKLILSVSSPYFKNLLSLKAHISQAVSNVQLNSLDGEGVQQLIEFFYTSAISLTNKNVWKLLPAASLLQCDEIVTLCSDFLLTQMQVENCLQIHRVATHCLCSNLLSETTKFIKENFDKVLEEEVFLEMPVDMLIAHLKRMNEVVLDQEQMLRAVKCWLIHSIDDRQTQGLKIMATFPKLETKLQDFIPIDMLREDDDSCITNGVNGNHNTMDTDEASPDSGFTTMRLPTKVSKRPAPDDDEFMCFECAETFDTKMELDEHEKTHKIATDLSMTKKIKIEKQDLSEYSASSYKQSPSTEMFKNAKKSQLYRPYRIESKSPSEHFDINKNSNSFNTHEENTSSFAESLKSLQYTPNEALNSSSMFDEYMRSRGLDGPEFGINMTSTPKINYNSVMDKQQFTITVTNATADGSQLNYICPVCGKCYGDQDSLNKHLEVHSGFICNICGKSYTTKSNLQTHMKKHNGEKPYDCNLCDKSFTSLCVLKVHLRSHTGEKPFACPTCGVAFAKNIHLKRHLSIHTGIKPHECKICNKKFSRSDHLKRHVQSIHTQDRPHICSLCGKDFVRKYELNKHMKQLHWGFTVGEEGQTGDSFDSTTHESLLNNNSAVFAGNDSMLNKSDLLGGKSSMHNSNSLNSRVLEGNTSILSAGNYSSMDTSSFMNNVKIKIENGLDSPPEPMTV